MRAGLTLVNPRPLFTFTTGQLMIDLIISAILAVVILIGILVASNIEHRRWVAAELRRLKADHRTIDAIHAIREFEAGRGLLLRNQSDLPGDWWYLRNEDWSGELGNFTQSDVRDCGLVLEFKSTADRLATEAYEGKVETICFALEDPAEAFKIEAE